MTLFLFSRIVLRLMPLIAALCAVIPAAGGRPLHSDAAWEQFGFTSCELPCFAGITPGRTPFQQTPFLLRQNIPIIQNRMFNTGAVVNFWASAERYDLAGVTRHLGGVVDEIRLNSTVPVEYLIAQLGTPDCIALSSSPLHPNTTLFWMRQQISISALLRTSDTVIDLSARAPLVSIYRANVNDCDAPEALPWRGFAPLWDYVEEG